MRIIDISTNDAMARTLPAAGKIVTFYNQFGTPFAGKVEYNRWFRPIFFMLVNDDWYRINFVPKGWNEISASKKKFTVNGYAVVFDELDDSDDEG